MNTISIKQKLLRLVADSRFAAIESMASRPNLFKIVGRTFTETWHSMFLGWLLDPNGSHNLGDFSLKRLLVALANPNLQGNTSEEIEQIAKIASIGDLMNAAVVPNEDNQQEYDCPPGRIDVFIQGISCPNEPDMVILIEQKVNATIQKAQCKKYADWLYKQYPDHLKVLVMLAPADRLGATSEETIGDARWNALDYQTLHDVLLVPTLTSPLLSLRTKPLIEQYVDILRVPSKGRKLAVTDEEKELAEELYDRHKEAFDAILTAIAPTVDIGSSGKITEKKRLVIKINGNVIQGNSVSGLYEAALRHIVKNDIAFESELPYETSNKRYLISKTPQHQGGNPFRVPVEYKGFFMEAHKSRNQAMKDLIRFLKRLGCSVSVK